MTGEAGLVGAIDIEAHSRHSVLRERIVEHLFIGEALRRLWQFGIYDTEILRAEFDAGYDLVLSRGAIVRHVQFKAVRRHGKRDDVGLSIKLLDKPSGCVIWIVVTDQLAVDGYLWFGGAPGTPLPDILDGPIARHTKPNTAGVKTHRPAHRIVKRSRFEKLREMDEVLEKLLGPLPGREGAGADAA